MRRRRTELAGHPELAARVRLQPLPFEVVHDGADARVHRLHAHPERADRACQDAAAQERDPQPDRDFVEVQVHVAE